MLSASTVTAPRLLPAAVMPPVRAAGCVVNAKLPRGSGEMTNALDRALVAPAEVARIVKVPTVLTDSVVKLACPVPSVGSEVVPLSELADSVRFTVGPDTTLPNLSASFTVTWFRVVSARVLFGCVTNVSLPAAGEIVNGADGVVTDPFAAVSV